MVIVGLGPLCYDSGHFKNGLASLPPYINRPFLFAFSLLVSMVLAASVAPGWAEANGRATLLLSQEQGPYVVDVSILPAEAVVTNTHLSILLRSLEGDEVLTQAQVEISATGPAGSTDLGPIPAPNDVAPQFYEATVPFDLEGDWEVMIVVNSDLGQETVVVPMYVNPGGGGINWVLLAALGVMIIAAGVWTWDRVAGRSQARRRA